MDTYPTKIYAKYSLQLSFLGAGCLCSRTVLSVGFRTSDDAKGSGEKAEVPMLNIHKWACLVQILPSYTLDRSCKTQEQKRGCKTQVSLTLRKKSSLSFTHQQITRCEHIIAIISIFLVLKSFFQRVTCEGPCTSTRESISLSKHFSSLQTAMDNISFSTPLTWLVEEICSGAGNGQNRLCNIWQSRSAFLVFFFLRCTFLIIHSIFSDFYPLHN